MECTVEQERVVVWTGHRPQRVGGYDETNPRVVAIKTAIREAILAAGPCATHVTGGALGVDQWAAEEVLTLRRSLQLRLVLLTPFPGFEDRWPPVSRQRLLNIAKRADEHRHVDEAWAPNVYQARNLAMLDCLNGQIGHVEAVYDGSSGGTHNCVREAQRRGLTVNIIDPLRVWEAWGC